jgi:hypothetical protein
MFINISRIWGGRGGGGFLRADFAKILNKVPIVWLDGAGPPTPLSHPALTGSQLQTAQPVLGTPHKAHEQLVNFLPLEFVQTSITSV